MGRNGLLAVRKEVSFNQVSDLIVVPQHIIPGILTALHVNLVHLLKTRLAKVFYGYFFAL